MTFRICLRPKGSVGWMGAIIYTQNLAKAIAMHSAETNADITVSMPNRYFDRATIKLAKETADRLRIIPRGLLNPWRYDFVYPEFAGVRAPFQWGAWIPDLQERHLPDLFSSEDQRWRGEICENAATAAPVVVFSSNMAKQDFLKLYPKAESKCAILNFTSCPAPEWTQGDPLKVQAQYELPDRFFLVSNQFWKHKDHHAIITALDILGRQGHKPIVVCTGATDDYRDPEYSPRLQQRVAELGLGEQFRILGLIPRLDQIQLMRRSIAVIQPSLFEGWSTVVEDARSLGKPMVLSDFPVHVEQNPPGAMFFQQGNAEELAATMLEAWTTLPIGPDLEVEAAAVDTAMKATAKYGKTFIEIARSVQ